MLYFKNLGPKRSKKYAYEMGKDCALNGANGKNCSLTIFSSSKNTKAWEDGKQSVKIKMDYEKLLGAVYIIESSIKNCPDHNAKHWIFGQCQQTLYWLKEELKQNLKNKSS